MKIIDIDIHWGHRVPRGVSHGIPRWIAIGSHRGSHCDPTGISIGSQGRPLGPLSNGAHWALILIGSLGPLALEIHWPLGTPGSWSPHIIMFNMWVHAGLSWLLLCSCFVIVNPLSLIFLFVFLSFFRTLY